MRRMTGLAIFLAGILVVVTPVAAASLPAYSMQGTHVVRFGETLFCIARAYGVDPWAIASQNGLVYVNALHAGLVLQIPYAPKTLPAGPTCPRQFGAVAPSGESGYTEACACRVTHLIATGDTLTSIALKYQSTTWALMRCNAIQNPHYIRIGDTLCVP